MFYRFIDRAGQVTLGECDPMHLQAGAEEITEAEFDAELEAARAASAAAQLAVVPLRCSRLGLKRALSETGPMAVFPQPEWPAVKAAIDQDPELAEDWELAVSLERGDPLVQSMIALRKYDAATVDKILVRAAALVA